MTTTRQQILRSSTPGQVPAAGARMPGELWTTFPDLQLGVIDASKNAQKLIAVRFFSTTANYAVGDFVIQAGVLYAAKGAITAGAFNATQWTQIAAATDANGPYLPIAGGTLTGALVLAADPGAALGAATKQYVDGKVTAAPFLPLAGGTLTGLVTLSGPPTVPLHAATKAYVDAGAFVPIGGGTMTGDLVLNRDPQVALGAVTKQYADTKYSASNPSGYQTAAQVTASLASYLPLTGGTLVGNATINTAGNAVLNVEVPSTLGTFGFNSTALMVWHQTAGASLSLNPDSSLTFNGSTNAFKNGGGPWAAISDARIKTVESDYASGLNEIMRLAPVYYRYNGNDKAPDAPDHFAGDTSRPYVGLIAQAVETVMPEMVTQREGWIDGEKVTDLRTLDTGPLVYALVNAVKTLKAEIDALKAGAR